MTIKVSGQSHERLKSSAEALLGFRRAALISLAEIYRDAGISKATTYRDVEFIDWWKSKVAADREGMADERENEIRKWKNKHSIQSKIVDELRLEIRLARTVIAAQTEEIRQLARSGSNLRSLPTARSINTTNSENAAP